jgi:hypothetical protein
MLGGIVSHLRIRMDMIGVRLAFPNMDYTRYFFELPAYLHS